MSQVIVVTGATSGLGRIAAGRLAAEGAHLVLIARNRTKADDTCAEILAATPAAQIDVALGDLTRMDDVRRLGADLAVAYNHIDVLVNNAGIHAFEQRITSDGLPEMVAVNYLAPWLLTQALIPALTRTPGARVVNVASEASKRHGTLLLPDDLTDTDSFTVRASSLLYGKSKLLDIMFTLELARRLEGTGVTANCLDPGFNVTGLGRELGFAAPLERILRALHVGDPRRGAGLIVDLATDPALSGITGKYFTLKNREVIAPTPPADDPRLRARLWSETEALLGAGFVSEDTGR